MCPMLNNIASTVEELDRLERASPGCTQPPFNRAKIAAAQQVQQQASASSSAPQVPAPQQALPGFGPPPSSADGQGGA